MKKGCSKLLVLGGAVSTLLEYGESTAVRESSSWICIKFCSVDVLVADTDQVYLQLFSWHCIAFVLAAVTVIELKNCNEK
jgi:hypothetical protein